MGADGATSREGAAESRHGGVGSGREGARIYHSHVTKFSPHRKTLLTSTEHVASLILYIIAAAFPAQHVELRCYYTFLLNAMFITNACHTASYWTKDCLPWYYE